MFDYWHLSYTSPPSVMLYVPRFLYCYIGLHCLCSWSWCYLFIFYFFSLYCYIGLPCNCSWSRCYLLIFFKSDVEVNVAGTLVAMVLATFSVTYLSLMLAFFVVMLLIGLYLIFKYTPLPLALFYSNDARITFVGSVAVIYFTVVSTSLPSELLQSGVCLWRHCFLLFLSFFVHFLVSLSFLLFYLLCLPSIDARIPKYVGLSINMQLVYM